MKINPKVKLWQPPPEYKGIITFIPKAEHNQFHDQYITNHKPIRIDYNNHKFIENLKDYDQEHEREDRRELYQREINGDWTFDPVGEEREIIIDKPIELPNYYFHQHQKPKQIITWREVRNIKADWEEWTTTGYVLYHTAEFKRWRLVDHQGDTLGTLPYFTLQDEAFAWAEKIIRGDKDDIESLGRIETVSTKELPINITLERAKIINDLVPIEIHYYNDLATRCSNLWNCHLSIGDAKQLLKEVYEILKEEEIEPNFWKNG